MVTPHSTLATRIEMEVGKFHELEHKWCLWAHLPHDTDWSINSYKPVYTFTTLEETIAITETLPEALVKNCMLFLMRDGVKPMWEDPKNRNGGCFSYKVSNKQVYTVWKELSYVLVGSTISKEPSFVANVTGITISPKKNFCIIKIWMSTCANQNPAIVTGEVKDLSSQGSLFKKHVPEY
jgi:Eukaryotic initiation factor 4E